MFQSGFTANAGTVAAILDKQDVIVSDRLNHASIIDGARLSRAEIKVFEHKDADHADALLRESKAEGRRQLLVTDGVFSMDGDIAPLPALVEVAERHGAIMMIDDAHAIGRPRYGRRGDRRPLRPARPGRRPGRDALEGDRRAGRVHRRAPRADRVAAEPRPAPPVLDERAAGGGRRVHRGARHHRRRARAARPALVEHRVVQGRAARARVRYRGERDADHAGDHRGRGADAGVRAPAVRGGRVLPGDRVPHRGRRAPRACGRSSPRTTRRRTWARRSRCSGGSAPSSVCARDPGSGSGRVRARRGSTGPGRSRTRRPDRTRPSEGGSRGAPRTRRAARSRPPCDGRDVPR